MRLLLFRDGKSAAGVFASSRGTTAARRGIGPTIDEQIEEKSHAKGFDSWVEPLLSIHYRRPGAGAILNRS